MGSIDCFCSVTITRTDGRYLHHTKKMLRGQEKPNARLAELRDILGHSNIATIDRYSHSNARRMQEMVEGL